MKRGRTKTDEGEGWRERKMQQGDEATYERKEGCGTEGRSCAWPGVSGMAGNNWARAAGGSEDATSLEEEKKKHM